MLRVLVPSDGSANSLYAIRYVIDEFKKRQDLEIHLLNVQPLFSKLITDYIDKSDRMEFHQEQTDAALLTTRQMLDAAGIPYSVHSELGNKVDCIVDAARRLHCDSIIMSTARKSSLVRLIENSVTNQVLERTSVPVEVIAGEAASKFERIGIPAGVGAGAGIVALWMASS
ncbi:universal stress protein [Comamonas sp.]|uniref:universal stress protein n=1 Tax=Comamonas sp. TaxID=34028 RepID=UPI002FCC54CF